MESTPRHKGFSRRATQCISRLHHKYTVPLFSELLSCQRFSELRHERTRRCSMNLSPTWATGCAASKGTILNVCSHASGLNGVSRRLLGSATIWRSESRKKRERGAQLPHYVFHVPKHRHAMHFGGHSRKGEARRRHSAAVHTLYITRFGDNIKLYCYIQC